MKYAVLAIAFFFATPVLAQEYGDGDAQASYYNEQNQRAYEEQQQEMQQQELINERYEAEQREQQLENEYQMQTPAQQFTNQFGDCYTCQ